MFSMNEVKTQKLPKLYYKRRFVAENIIWRWHQRIINSGHGHVYDRFLFMWKYFTLLNAEVVFIVKSSTQHISYRATLQLYFNHQIRRSIVLLDMQVILLQAIISARMLICKVTNSHLLFLILLYFVRLIDIRRRSI